MLSTVLFCQCQSMNSQSQEWAQTATFLLPVRNLLSPSFWVTSIWYKWIKLSATQYFSWDNVLLSCQQTSHIGLLFCDLSATAQFCRPTKNNASLTKMLANQALWVVLRVFLQMHAADNIIFFPTFKIVSKRESSVSNVFLFKLQILDESWNCERSFGRWDRRVTKTK